MSNKPKLSVVLGSYNRKNYLKLTINSIRKELDNFNKGYEILGGCRTGLEDLGQNSLFVRRFHNWIFQKTTEFFRT